MAFCWFRVFGCRIHGFFNFLRSLAGSEVSQDLG